MAIHDKAINALSLADYQIIENEHKALKTYLHDIRNACACSHLDQLTDDRSKCDREQQMSCQGRLPSFLFHINNLLSEHFAHEEQIMLSRPHVTEDYEYFRVHREAHADILQKMQALVDECFALRNRGDTPEIYNRFYGQISELIDEHDQRFDDPFISSTKILN